MIRCVVFDFDGVLVESNEVKRDAFRLIFEGAGVTDGFVAECLRARPDGNRFDVIRLMLERLRTARQVDSTEPLDHQVTKYAAAYNAICEEYAATCPEVAGAGQLLPRWASRFALYVNSATLEDPLRRVVARRGWAGYFRSVFGSPASKVENLNAILTREAAGPDEVVFVGDGSRDVRAAQSIGCRFVGVRNSHNDFDPSGLTMIDQLHELDAILEAITGGTGV